jgi:SAM-dependent methyltransferase
MGINGARSEADHKRLWNREYEHGRIIPSTTRGLPSKALVLYEGLVDFGQLNPALDAGCGNGRNAIYLAKKGCEVYAADFSEQALELVRSRASEAGVTNNLQVRKESLCGRWSFNDNFFALALDSYVFCHFHAQGEREAYRRELWRVLRPSGILYSSVFCVDDAYYAELAEDDNRVVLDPRNGIQKRLYSEDEFQEFFSVGFRQLFFTKFRFDDIVCDRPYRRSILTLLAEKQTHGEVG